jgi:hypothetical protein
MITENQDKKEWNSPKLFSLNFKETKDKIPNTDEDTSGTHNPSPTST